MWKYNIVFIITPTTETKSCFQTKNISRLFSYRDTGLKKQGINKKQFTPIETCLLPPTCGVESEISAVKYGGNCQKGFHWRSYLSSLFATLLYTVLAILGQRFLCKSQTCCILV